MRACTYSSHSKLTLARELLGVECALVNINNFVLLGAKTATKPIAESLLIGARGKAIVYLRGMARNALNQYRGHRTTLHNEVAIIAR